MNNDLLIKWQMMYHLNDVCMAHLLISEEANELSEEEKISLLKWAGEYDQ